MSSAAPSLPEPNPLPVCPACTQEFLPNLLRDTVLPCCGKLVCTECRAAAATTKPDASPETGAEGAESSGTEVSEGDAAAGGQCPLCSAAVPARASECIAMIQAKMKAGEAWAQFLLGSYLQIGKIVVRNPVDGLKLLRLAADQGHLGALAAVGRSLLVGEGVKKSPKKGVEILKKAAAEDDPDALFYLSTAFSMGLPSVRADKKKGEK